MPEEFKIGSLVWARMKGFAPWPGKVVVAPEECKKPKKMPGPMHCIYFFGSNNFAWIEEKCIKDYHEYKSSFTSTKSGIKEAVAAIEAFIKEGHVDNDEEKANEEDFDKLRTETEEPSPVKEKKERKRKKTVDAVVPRKRRSSVGAISGSSSPISYGNGPGPSSPPSSTLAIARSNARQLVENPLVPEVLNDDVDVSLSSPGKKNIVPSDKIFGFIGLGTMGRGIVKNLLATGHKVHVWNRSPNISEKFISIGAVVSQTPMDVVEQCDITFSCVADPQVSRQLIYGNCGVIAASEGKGYVEMTTIDDKSSQEYAETFATQGGRYLEAQLQGSKQQAESGELVVLAAGDRGLFDECQSAFDAIGKSSFFLGKVGTAAKMNLVLTTISTISIVGLCEGMGLANATGIKLTDFIEVFSSLQFQSDFLIKKAAIIAEASFPTHKALSLAQKDLQLTLDMASRQSMPLQLTATANELFKVAKRGGLNNHDESAVYLKLRH